jgi:hypothetical protein
MDFSVSVLISGFLFGVIGLYLFKEGRKGAHVPWMLLGVALMAFPYVVRGDLLNWGVGLALTLIAYAYR